MSRFQRILITLSLLLCAYVTTTQASVSLEEFVASDEINPETTAVMVRDLRTGKTLEAHNIATPLIPASIMKAVTIASLIDETGIDYRYRTKVYLTGKIRKDTVEGNLLVRASGDPSLNAPCAPGSADFVAEIKNELEKKNIVCIRGRIVLDESIFSGPDTPPTWAKGDLQYSYGTSPHGFNFEANRSGKSAVKSPGGVFERKLKEALSQVGISVSGESLRDEGRHLLFEHISAPVDEIMRSCMMRSDNLFAECLLRTIAIAKGKDGSTDKGAELSLSHWKQKGANAAGVKIVDGSGLSRSNRMTARFMTEVLAQKSADVDYASFFPLAGQEGTLVNFLKGTPLDGYIAMKTGSMNGVQCYAGYKLDDDYAPTHTIVIILNNFKTRSGARQAAQKFLLDIFSENE